MDSSERAPKKQKTDGTGANGAAASDIKTVGFIGLGAMGMPMAINIIQRLKCELYVYDISAKAVEDLVKEGAVAAKSPREMAPHCDVIVSMVPNDQVMNVVVSDPKEGLLPVFKGIHISCSTVSPKAARATAQLHAQVGGSYIGAPVFARADGMAKRAAGFVVGGDEKAVDVVMPVLDAMAMGVFRFGADAGAGNVVKLCGNFMIAAAIESCAEACSLAEKNGLDRVDVMDMLTSTIFDCLIYKGYGMRTAHRQHIPGQPLVGPGFQLKLGLKDVAMTRQVAADVEAPMPFASVMHDRLLASLTQGRGNMDWSAVALKASEEAGVDISAWLEGGSKAVAKSDSIAPI